MRNEKILMGIIIVLSIMIIGVLGYIIYDKNNNNAENINMSEIYIELKNNERKIITSSGEYSLEEYLSNYNYGNKIESEYQYSFVDLDSDGISEIIFCCSRGKAIVHYENNSLYGYDEISYMSNIKSDGTFEGRTDSYYTAIVTLSFDKATYNKNILSYSYTGKYIIEGKEVTPEEYDSYLNKQEQKAGLNYIYVYDNKEYDSVDFKNINDSEYDNKDIIEERIYKVLEIYNGPGYGDGISFCGEFDGDDYLLPKEYNYYYHSKTFNTKQDLYEYWGSYLSADFIKDNDDNFIEQNGKLYCSSSGKDGGFVYNKEKNKFIVKEVNEDKTIVIGRVWFADVYDFNGFNEYDNYFDVIFTLIKNNTGTLVVDNYTEYTNYNYNY